jgi:hypothetical protein
MAKNTFLDWDATANNNTDIGGINIAEGCPPSNINNAIREAMKQLRVGVDGEVVYSAKSGAYTAVAADNNAIIRFTAAATLTLTAAATLGANFHLMIIADGGNVTIDPNGAETIDGASTIVVPNGTTASIVCSGTAFFSDKNKIFVNVMDYGAKGDGSDDYTAITAALASGHPIYFPKPSVKYAFATPIAINGTAKQIRSDVGVIFHYTGSVGAAFSLSGSYHDLELGEILATLAPYCIGYFNLNYSHIKVRTAGQCTAANLLHDAGLQTANAGNNKWDIDIIQGGSVPFGIDIKSHATYTLEGETWNVLVGYSNTTCMLRIGTAGNNKARWNEYNISPDGQGITPMLVDVYNDSNFINVRKWAGLAGAPPIAHVRFNTGTGSNYLFAEPGTFGPLTVLDSGTNFSFVPGIAGTMKMFGRLGIGTDLAGTKLHIADDIAAGGDIFTVENLAVFELSAEIPSTAAKTYSAFWPCRKMRTG